MLPVTGGGSAAMARTAAARASDSWGTQGWGASVEEGGGCGSCSEASQPREELSLYAQGRQPGLPPACLVVEEVSSSCLEAAPLGSPPLEPCTGLVPPCSGAPADAAAAARRLAVSK